MNRREHLRVETELEDGAGAGFEGELGVGDFVGPCAECAGLVDFDDWGA